MKRFTVLFISAIMLTLLTGCESTSSSSTSTQSSSSLGPTPTRPVRIIPIPRDERLTTEKVNDIVVESAFGRKWSIEENAGDSVTIHLRHRRYDSTLTFKIKSNVIEMYSDSFYIYGDEPKKRKDPEGWINYLVQDISKRFSIYLARAKY